MTDAEMREIARGIAETDRGAAWRAIAMFAGVVCLMFAAPFAAACFYFGLPTWSACLIAFVTMYAEARLFGYFARSVLGHQKPPIPAPAGHDSDDA